MKTIKITKQSNSVTIVLRNNKLTTILNINNKFTNKANSIINNCVQIGYVLIMD